MKVNTNTKIYLSRKEIENLYLFVQMYEDCDVFSVSSSTDNGIGECKYAMTEIQNNDDHVVDNLFRDITDYDSW